MPNLPEQNDAPQIQSEDAVRAILSARHAQLEAQLRLRREQAVLAIANIALNLLGIGGLFLTNFLLERLAVQRSPWEPSQSQNSTCDCCSAPPASQQRTEPPSYPE